MIFLGSVHDVLEIIFIQTYEESLYKNIQTHHTSEIFGHKGEEEEVARTCHQERNSNTLFCMCVKSLFNEKKCAEILPH
jgi:hypothetical protein